MHSAAAGPSAITPAELRAKAAAETGGRLRVVAVDATWSNARKMKQKYPAWALQVGGGAAGLATRRWWPFVRLHRCGCIFRRMTCAVLL